MSAQHTPKDALEILVRDLNATHWSSWQSTAKFDTALRVAEDVLQRERIRDAAPELLEALRAALEFIDGIRQDLHHERVADWYPEGAHNSASAMSESMRLIGNRCADFDAASAAIAKATGEPQ